MPSSSLARRQYPLALSRKPAARCAVPHSHSVSRYRGPHRPQDHRRSGRGQDGRTPLSREKIHSLRTLPLKGVIPDWHFHLGRQFATMYLLSQGVPVPQTADFLGHHDWATTTQNAQPFAQDSRPSRKAMDELSERVRPDAECKEDETDA